MVKAKEVLGRGGQNWVRVNLIGFRGVRVRKKSIRMKPELLTRPDPNLIRIGSGRVNSSG